MTWFAYGVIALLLIVTIVLIIVVIRTGAIARLRGKAVPGEDAPVRAGDIAPPAGLSTALAIAGHEIGVLVAGGRGPVEVPWVLALGAGGGDLEALLPPPVDPLHDIGWLDEKRLARAGTVSFRTGGVVLGFEDGLVGGPGAERRLAELLHQVEIIRPDRPIDAIAVVVPWHVLAGSPDDPQRDAVIAYGRQLYRLILAIQQRTGWRLPVHVLLSECDRVPGFAAYGRAALAHADYPAIGWPAPKSLDSMFETGWIDEAFAALSETLAAQQLHLLMGAAHRIAREDILLLPGRLAAIKPALTVLLTQMLQSSAYHEGFMLRGVFLTGDTATPPGGVAAPAALAVEHQPVIPIAIAPPALMIPPAGQPLPLPIGPAAAPPLGPRPVEPLAQALFLGKIFPESCLAQPAYGERTRRHRMIRRTKLALAAALALFALGITGIRYQNARYMPPVSDLLASVTDIEGQAAAQRAATRDPGTGNCIENATTPILENLTRQHVEHNRRLTLQLLDEMSALDVNRVATILAPTSYLSHVDGHIGEAIRSSFRDVVFQAIAESMASRAGIDALVARDAADPASDGYWPTTAGNVVDYDKHYTIAQSLQTPSARDATLVAKFAELVRYALGADLPRGFTQHYSLYAAGIAQYPVPCISSIAARGALRSAIFTRYRTAVGRRYLDTPAARLIDDMPVLFAGGTTATDDELLQRLVRDIDALGEQLSIPGRYDWVSAIERKDLTLPAVDALKGLETVNPNFADNLPNDAAGLVLAEATRLRSAQLFDAYLLDRGGAATSPVVAVPAVGPTSASPLPAAALPAAAPTARTPRLSQALIDTRDFLRLLFAQPFMSHMTGSPIAIAGNGWDYQPLQGVAVAVKGYDGFVGTASGEMPGALRQMALGTAQRHLAAQIDEIIDRATPGRARSLSDGEANAFVQALPMLGSLRDNLNEIGAGDAATRLDAKVATQAGVLLADADRQLGSDGGPYAIDDAGLAAWRGTGSLAAAVFGVQSEDELAGTLPLRRARVATIARGQAAPLVAYLTASGTTAGAINAARAERWRSILQTLQSYEAGSPSNTLARLERFMTIDIDRLQRDCGQIRGLRSASGDYFASQQSAIASRIGARCRIVATTGARTTFDRLRDAFNTTLAGRFPFGDARSAAAADPGAVQRFFAEFGDSIPAVKAQIDADHPGSAASAVLGQLDDVRIALAPMLAGPGPLAYAVDVAFFTDPLLSRGQRQIVEAIIGTTPANQAQIPHGPASFTWANGQPVALALRWGVNAPSVPIEAIDPAVGRCVPPPGGGVATVRTAGNWALLRFLALHGTDAAPSVEQGIPVAVDVPVCTNLQRAAGGEDVNGQARISLRLALSATVRTPDKPDRHDPVSLPVFPRAIPALSGNGAP